MDEHGESPISLDSVGFIFRHPWIIVCSFLFVFNLVHAYVSGITPAYQCKSAILFEFSGDSKAKASTIAERKQDAQAALAGRGLEVIVREALKDLDEKERLAAYNKLLERVRDSDIRLGFAWKEDGAQNQLEIAYADPDPKMAHRVVKAATDLVVRESEKRAEEKMGANITFLTNQMQFYKDRLDKIDQESTEIRNELIARFPELNDSEKSLIAKSVGDPKIATQGTVQKFTMYEKTVTDLADSLAALEKKRDGLQKSLDSGAYLSQYTSEQLSKEDVFVAESSKAVTAKELEIASFLTKGFKREHPMVKQLQAEIDQLKQMRKNRIAELRNRGTVTEGADEMREKVQIEIEELDFQIGYARDRLKLAKSSQESTRAELKSGELVADDLRDKASRLDSLQKERQLNEQYYVDMRKKLADAELKYRIDRDDTGFKVTVIREPKIPRSPMPSPKSSRALLAGLAVGLGLGAGIAYLLDMLQNPVRSGPDLAQHFKVPVLGIVDRIVTHEELAALATRRKFIIIGLAAALVVTRVIMALLAPLLNKI